MTRFGLRGVVLLAVALAITWRVFEPVADCYAEYPRRPWGTSNVGAEGCIHPEYKLKTYNRPNVPLTLLHVGLLVAVGVLVWYWPQLFPQVAAQQATSKLQVLRVQRIEMVNYAGQVRAMLVVPPNGLPELRLYDADGRVRIWLAVLPDGSPGLGLYDAAGRVLFQAP
jgi:hypothetical protein